MRQGIRNKYHLIKYYYTHMFMQSLYGIGSFFNPLFFQTQFGNGQKYADQTHEG